jgi:XTP/dITP diphosphohydrolase
MTDDARDQPLLLATSNAHKVREYEAILAGLPFRLLTPADLGFTDEVEETGATFLENARLKAAAYRAVAQAGGMDAWVLADDSGIEVEALDGAPGVFSTRWAGPDSTAESRNQLLLERLRDVPAPARGARFRCVIVLLSPAGEEFIGDGALVGRIAFAPRQRPGYGFGYDPIFELPDRGFTVGEIPPAEKDAISHRGQAGRQIRPKLEAALGLLPDPDAP